MGFGCYVISILYICIYCRGINRIRFDICKSDGLVMTNHDTNDLKAIDYAVEHSNFQHAFELANLSAKHKLPDIHLKKVGKGGNGIIGKLMLHLKEAH